MLSLDNNKLKDLMEDHGVITLNHYVSEDFSVDEEEAILKGVIPQTVPAWKFVELIQEIQDNFDHLKSSETVNMLEVLDVIHI